MKKLINFIPVGVFSLIATVFVAYVLLSPPSAEMDFWLSWLHFKYSDKVAHVVLFFILNMAYLYDYTKYRFPHHTKINKDLMITVVASSLGLLSETAQLVMALGREFDKADIIADVIGTFLALLIMRLKGGHLLRKYVFAKKKRHHHHHHHHSSNADNDEVAHQNG